MIELLGVGVSGPEGDWVFRQVSLRLGRQLTMIVASRPHALEALLDVIAGRVIPVEGRAWIGGVPLMSRTAWLVQKRVADVRARVAPARPWPWLSRLRALAGRGHGEPCETPVDRLRREIARAVRGRPEYLLVRDLDVGVTREECARVLNVLDIVRRTQRLGVIVSMADTELARHHAERLIVLQDSGVVFDGIPERFPPAPAIDGRRPLASLLG